MLLKFEVVQNAESVTNGRRDHSRLSVLRQKGRKRGAMAISFKAARQFVDAA